MLTHPSGISARFQTTFHFDLPGGVAARGIWTNQNCICSWTCGAGRPHVGLCSIFLVIIIIMRLKTGFKSQTKPASGRYLRQSERANEFWVAVAARSIPESTSMEAERWTYHRGVLVTTGAFCHTSLIFQQNTASAASNFNISKVATSDAF